MAKTGMTLAPGSVLVGVLEVSGRRSAGYQLMSYLAQIMDGVLKNLDLEKYEEKMGELERAVEELQRTSSQAAG